MPFISQPRTMIVSPAPEETSFQASRRKWWSCSPRAPSLSRRATTLSGSPASLGATIGTFSARTRPGRAARQRVQGSRTNGAPAMASQRSPGRYVRPTVTVLRSHDSKPGRFCGPRRSEERKTPSAAGGLCGGLCGGPCGGGLAGGLCGAGLCGGGLCAGSADGVPRPSVVPAIVPATMAIAQCR
ncbi:hypothetical protein B0I32_129136 [Nonomuraea fuscirosea]|uniref:Uncharacterized protein n=1 Tax=Nonomuraea fuscirosea TaxID=1291556 RepID=A0A2T0M6D6_9ACTN|nr:hypothetical protein B0I32_129136 [Nonomuraea fuscirosea]